MKWTVRGVGWLIAGLLICASAFPGNGIADVMSTIAIGLVFIAIFLMKQRFQPRGLGWFIAGGILLAFCLDMLFGIAGGFFSSISADSSDLSAMLMGFICACGCMFMFVRKNKPVLDGTDNEESEFPYQEEVFKEYTDTVETTKVETEQVVTPVEDKMEVEFEVSDDKQ
jgi:hypothetical protein